MKTSTSMISHDNAHCEGAGCPLRATCWRYLLHVHASGCGMDSVCYLSGAAYADGHCPDYWRKEAYGC